MDKTEGGGKDEERADMLPSDGLLMPRGEDEAEEGEHHACHTQHRLASAAAVGDARQMGVAHAVDGIHVETDKHP